MNSKPPSAFTLQPLKRKVQALVLRNPFTHSHEASFSLPSIGLAFIVNLCLRTSKAHHSYLRSLGFLNFSPLVYDALYHLLSVTCSFRVYLKLFREVCHTYQDTGFQLGFLGWRSPQLGLLIIRVSVWRTGLNQQGTICGGIRAKAN